MATNFETVLIYVCKVFLRSSPVLSFVTGRKLTKKTDTVKKVEDTRDSRDYHYENSNQYLPPVYSPPAPVYHPPAPTYVAPQPVYQAPAPVYHAPAPSQTYIVPLPSHQPVIHKKNDVDLLPLLAAFLPLFLILGSMLGFAFSSGNAISQAGIQRND